MSPNQSPQADGSKRSKLVYQSSIDMKTKNTGKVSDLTLGTTSTSGSSSTNVQSPATAV